MSTKPLTITISGVEALECAKALEDKARTEAGHSQQPDLFGPESTAWWALAKELRRRRGEASLERKAHFKKLARLRGTL